MQVTPAWFQMFNPSAGPRENVQHAEAAATNSNILKLGRLLELLFSKQIALPMQGLCKTFKVFLAWPAATQAYIFLSYYISHLTDLPCLHASSIRLRGHKRSHVFLSCLYQ